MRAKQFRGEKKEERVSEKKGPRKYYVNPWILDLDIEGCFNNIKHDWLMANTPIPRGYKGVFEKILKSPTINIEEEKEEVKDVEEGSIEEGIIKSKGIPQGGIISPILMNWTLDGMEELIKKLCENEITESHGHRSFYYPEGKKEFVDKTKGVPKKRSREEYGARNKGWIVRYADDMIIGINNPEMVDKIQERIEEFLKERGLKISKEKSRKLKWAVGRQVDFLSWTFHFVKPIRRNWIIKAPRKAIGKRNDRLGLYVYPSRKATKRLKEKVKDLTSISRTNINIPQEIADLNLVLKGWSEYYVPGGKQTDLRVYLDNYIWKRTKKFVFNKFRKASQTNMMSRYFKTETGKWTSLNQKRDGYPYTQVLILRKNGCDFDWPALCPKRKLLNNSAISNPEGYVERQILIGKIRGQIREKLYGKQEGKCAMCNNQLIDWEDFVSFEDLKAMESDKSAITEKEMVEEKKLQEIWEDRDREVRELETTDEMITKNLGKMDGESIGFDYEKKWYQGLDVDHKIPKRIGGMNANLARILEDESNLQLVHKACHKGKYKEDMKKSKEIITRMEETLKEVDEARKRERVLKELLRDQDIQGFMREKSERTYRLIKGWIKTGNESNEDETTK